MENKMKTLSIVLLATIVLTTMQTVSASREDAQKVVFRCHATGNAFVIWNIFDLSDVDAYIEPTAAGSITCVGTALVEEDGGWPLSEWPYVAEPGSVCSIGSLEARWAHGDDSHILNAVFYSTEETAGFFWPEAAFGLGALDISTMMEFKAILVENEGSQQISGRALLGVLSHQYDYTPPEAYTVTVLLFIDLGEELPDNERWLPINVAWVDRNVTLPPSPDPIPVEKATVFQYSVELLGS